MIFQAVSTMENKQSKSSISVISDSSTSEFEEDEVAATISIESNTLQNLENLRHEGEFCDVILQVEGKEFPAHRSVLVASSEYFRKMFTIDMKEKSSKKVSIKSITSQAMNEILNSIYTQKISFSQAHIGEIIHAALLMQFQNVINAAAEFIEKFIEADNCFYYRDLVRFHPLECIEKVVRSFFVKQIWDIQRFPGYCDFNYDELSKIFCDDDLKVFEEIDVYELLMKWVNHDSEGRKEYLPILFKHVRLQFIPVDYILDNIKQNELIKKYPECRDLLEDALEYHIRPKFMHSQKHRNIFVEKQDILMLLPYRQSFQGFYKIKTNNWKRMAFDGLTDGSVWKDSAVANDHPVTVLCGGIDVGKNEAKNLAVCFNGISWLNMPSMNMTRCGAAAAIVNDEIYVFGGEHCPVKAETIFAKTDINPAASNFCKTYEKLIDKRCWEMFENSHVARSYFAAAVVDDQVYLIGGFKPGEITNGPGTHAFCKRACADTISYCPTTKTWKNMACLNRARAWFGCSVLNSKVFVLGGRCGGFMNGVLALRNINSIEIFNVQENLWTLVKNGLPDVKVLSACSINRKIYFSDINGSLYNLNVLTDCSGAKQVSCNELAVSSKQGILLPFSKHYYNKPILKVKKF